MNSRSQGTRDEVGRKRRTHRKSRLGCRNCKIRGVKCDETKPQCRKCTPFRVSCNYDPKAADLQLSIGGTASIKSGQNPPRSINQSLHSMIKSPAYLFSAIISDNNSSFQLDGQSMDRLGRFQMRTVLSIGTARGARIYQDEIIKLAYLHPYLMHVVLTLTAIHDRYLSASPARQTTTEAYHWSRAAALFNQKLSNLSIPLQSPDRDALWATAALLGVIAFSLVEATSPEEAWPLKSLADSRLEWLGMCEGKNTIWKVADPLRYGSIFHTVANELRAMVSPTSGGMEGIPSSFIHVYNLDNRSTAENNPYHTALYTLAPLLHIECVQSTLSRFS